MIHSDVFGDLVDAAGGRNRVGPYCTALVIAAALTPGAGAHGHDHGHGHGFFGDDDRRGRGDHEW